MLFSRGADATRRRSRRGCRCRPWSEIVRCEVGGVRLQSIRFFSATTEIVVDGGNDKCTANSPSRVWPGFPPPHRARASRAIPPPSSPWPTPRCRSSSVTHDPRRLDRGHPHRAVRVPRRPGRPLQVRGARSVWRARASRRRPPPRGVPFRRRVAFRPRPRSPRARSGSGTAGTASFAVSRGRDRARRCLGLLVRSRSLAMVPPPRRAGTGRTTRSSSR